MAVLTELEQQFFATGDATNLQAAEEATEPVVDPLALAALSKVDPAVVDPADAAVKPVVVDPVVEPAADTTELLRRSLAEAQQRVGALEQSIQQLQKPAEKTVEEFVPDPNDPLGTIFHGLDTMNKRVADLQAQLVEQQNQQANATTFNNFQTQVRSLKDEFVKTTPDFPDAYSHIRAAREADLKAYGLPDQQVRETIFREEAALAEAAIRQGRNPAEALYEMSKRHGYVPKTVVDPKAVVVTPKVKLENVAAAQAAAKNLPKTQVAEEVTLEGLKQASDSDLNKMVMDDKSWGKIVGRDQYPL